MFQKENALMQEQKALEEEQMRTGAATDTLNRIDEEMKSYF